MKRVKAPKKQTPQLVRVAQAIGSTLGTLVAKAKAKAGTAIRAPRIRSVRRKAATAAHRLRSQNALRKASRKRT